MCLRAEQIRTGTFRIPVLAPDRLACHGCRPLKRLPLRRQPKHLPSLMRLRMRSQPLVPAPELSNIPPAPVATGNPGTQTTMLPTPSSQTLPASGVTSPTHPTLPANGVTTPTSQTLPATGVPTTGTSQAVALPVAQPDPKGQVVVGPGGTAVRIPAGYVAQPAANGKGIVYRPAGSTGNANTIRIMEPTARYPSGYVRIYNSHGQPINPSTGKPESQANTHNPM